jgi:hypothetical protein
MKTIKELNLPKFYSEKLKAFVEIKNGVIRYTGTTINPEEVVGIDKAKEIITLLEDLVYESKTKHRMEKEVDQSRSKYCYLLGKNSDGKKVWLEAPSWDCSWYWGFGYIKQPGSHSHFSGLVGKQEYYDHEKQAWLQSDYIHNVYDSPQLIETCFSYNEGWKLAELFKQFYLLKEVAEFSSREKPNCHITSDSGVDHGDMKEWNLQINKIMIPKITLEIMRILTPEKEVKVFAEDKE